MTRIVLIGRPGAGKGTQGRRISEKLGIPFLVMREILEDEIRGGTELGKEIKGYMEEGKLVPDELIFRLMEKVLKDKESFVLDGFPRTVNQAEWLERVLSDSGGLTAALYLDVDEINVLKRIMGRLRCKKCGRYYNVFFDPPPDVRRCECGGELYQREDDRYNTIIKRLDEFLEVTFPVVEFYRKKGKLVKVNANENDIERVWEKVEAAVEKLTSLQ